MNEDQFQLSDDSDGEYEKDRRKKIAYNELVILEIQKQQQNAALLHLRDRKGHHSISKTIPKKSIIEFKLVIQKSIDLMVNCMGRVSRFVKGCRIEAIAACAILYCTLFLMMNTSSFLLDDKSAMIIDHEKEINPLMEHYHNLRDLYSSPIRVETANDDEHDTPFFWKIPFSGRPIEDVLRICVRAERIHDPSLLNSINATDLIILSTANIAAFSTESMIISTDIYQISTIFSSQRNFGRVFTVMKNPIHVAIDKYRYLVSSNSPQIMNMSFVEYFDSPYAEDNWMTRALTGKLSSFGGEVRSLSQDDLDSAIEILSQKCLVGLYPNLHEFLARLDNYFHWELQTRDMKKCRESVYTKAYDEYTKSLYPEEGSDLWRVVFKKNRFDMQLFRVAEHLFEDESVLSFKTAENSN